jgi:hypothetical protein
VQSGRLLPVVANQKTTYEFFDQELHSQRSFVGKGRSKLKKKVIVSKDGVVKQ